jgi:hypothetical protein
MAKNAENTAFLVKFIEPEVHDKRAEIQSKKLEDSILPLCSTYC